MARRFARSIVVLGLVLLMGSVPATAVALDGMSYWIWTDPGYLSTGVQGQIYHYGWTARSSATVRSIYLTKEKGMGGTYVECGQIFSAGHWVPTKHFVAYEDGSYTTGQVQMTFGDCAPNSWYTYYIYTEPKSPTNETIIYAGRAGDPFTMIGLFSKMPVGYPEASMEHYLPVPYDNAYSSFTALSRRGTSPMSWRLWERMYDPKDSTDGYLHQHDSGATYTRRSNSSWYSSNVAR